MFSDLSRIRNIQISLILKNIFTFLTPPEKLIYLVIWIKWATVEKTAMNPKDITISSRLNGNLVTQENILETWEAVKLNLMQHKEEKMQWTHHCNHQAHSNHNSGMETTKLKLVDPTMQERIPKLMKNTLAIGYLKKFLGNKSVLRERTKKLTVWTTRKEISYIKMAVVPCLHWDPG